MATNSTTQSSQKLAETLLSTAQPALNAGAEAIAANQFGQASNAALTAEQAANMQAMSGIQMGQIGIGSQQVGLQRQGLQASNRVAQQQQGLEVQGYNLGQQAYGEERTSAATAEQEAMMGLQGQVATSGVQGAKGANLAQSAQKQAYGMQLADIGRAQKQSQLTQQSELAGYGLSQEQYTQGMQNLALMAKANGLSMQQAQEQLQYGIAQNQQTGIQNAVQYASQLGNLQAGQYSTALGALAPIGYSAAVSPVVANVLGKK